MTNLARSIKITVGSTYFFSMYTGFTSKDIDELELVDTDEFSYYRQISGHNKCLFQLKMYSSKEEYINWHLASNLGMSVGKFLIPEFCNLIGFTIEDLPRLKPLIDILDDKHKYEEIIFNSYLTNNSFRLTQEQRDRAYSSYRKSRGLDT